MAWETNDVDCEKLSEIVNNSTDHKWVERGMQNLMGLFRSLEYVFLFASDVNMAIQKMRQKWVRKRIMVNRFAPDEKAEELLQKLKRRRI